MNVHVDEHPITKLKVLAIMTNFNNYYYPMISIKLLNDYALCKSVLSAGKHEYLINSM